MVRRKQYNSNLEVVGQSQVDKVTHGLIYPELIDVDIDGENEFIFGGFK